MKRILLLMLAFAALACGDSSTDPNNGSVVGTYALVSVNGHTLPAVDDNGNTISAGSVTLRGDNSFTVSETSAGDQQTTTGTYSVSGNSITFTPSTPGDTGAIGTFDGTTLTVDATDEGTLVFHKT